MLLYVVPEVPIAEDNFWEVLDPKGKKMAKPRDEENYYEKIAHRVISEMEQRVWKEGV
jgi:hypothetical protein